MKNYSVETIKSKLDELGISMAELGRMLGDVSGQRIGQYLANTRTPKADFWERWDKVFNETNVLNEPESVPFYDVVAVGGHSIIMEDQEAVYGGTTEMINPGSWFRSATGALRVYGHSMFPKYPAGCIVAFKDADKEVILWGEDYIIELSDRRVVKRIEKGENGFIKAVSYNKSEEYVYASIDIPVNKIKRLYMVLGKVELETSI
jgi:SOS-response transcriptional repressor LexA